MSRLVSRRRSTAAPIAALFAAMIAVALGTGAAAQHRGGAPNTLAPPDIPPAGAYIGAWVNPLGMNSDDGANEILQLPRFNSYITTPVGILHVYTLFGDEFPTATLEAVDANGSVPLVDWSCQNVGQVAAGTWDSTIAAYARAFKAYGKPAFLRWYWEMNLNLPGHAACGGYRHGAAYVAAWVHIWHIFKQVGANNVAFVWCPSSHGDSRAYYPGDAYVDWIAADGYDRYHLGANAFRQVYATFYATWSNHGKPLMVGETAATAIDQSQYISSLSQLLQMDYPKVKAYIYFDAPGDNANWKLTSNGIDAFRTLNASNYAFREP